MKFGCRKQPNWKNGQHQPIVSKYRLQLPSEEDIRKYMLENITEEQFKMMMNE